MNITYILCDAASTTHLRFELHTAKRRAQAFLFPQFYAILRIQRFPHPTKLVTAQARACKRGQRVVLGPPSKNPEIGNFYLFLILTPNLVSKVLY
jgi:hypothetical protein